MTIFNAVSFLSSKVGQFFLASISGIVLLASVYLKGKRSGVDSERQKALALDLQARRTRDEIDRKVAATSGSSAADRLRKGWSQE